ncbi:MAG TPA: TolC family protein [Candidatus Acidoferrum sp.]|nr:TolC family protein [Candidatus Acidoferrum sp.]
MKTNFVALSALTAALLLAGCAVGPDYKSALTQAPAQTPFINGKAATLGTDAVPTDWWKLYRDPALDALVEQSLQANADLRSAAANMERAEAQWRESRVQQLPTTTVTAGETWSRQVLFLGASPLSVENDIYNVNLGIAYQVDLFGKVRRAIEAARADTDAVRAAFEATRISVVAATVRNYVGACHANHQLEIVQQNLELQQQRLQLTQKLLDAGRANALQLATIAAQEAQTRALLPQLQARRDATLYQLAALLGRTPKDVPPAAVACKAAPVIASAMPVGDGAQLLHRRPDVLQAERALAGATARVGLATADFYPTVSLGAGIGSSAKTLDTLFTGNNQTWNYGPAISWSFPVINGTRARVQEAEKSVDAAAAHFDGVWLNALRETETALDAYIKSLERRAALADASKSSDEAARLTQLRFDAGKQSYLDLLQAELTAADARTNLAAGEADVTGLQVDLFLALGGGWAGI